MYKLRLKTYVTCVCFHRIHNMQFFVAVVYFVWKRMAFRFSDGDININRKSSVETNSSSSECFFLSVSCMNFTKVYLYVKQVLWAGRKRESLPTTTIFFLYKHSEKQLWWYFRCKTSNFARNISEFINNFDKFKQNVWIVSFIKKSNFSKRSLIWKFSKLPTFDWSNWILLQINTSVSLYLMKDSKLNVVQKTETLSIFTIEHFNFRANYQSAENSNSVKKLPVF